MKTCVYPVTQILLMLVHLQICVCVCVCDPAHSRYDWSWSPLAPGWMTLQSRTASCSPLEPIILYVTKKKEKRPRGLRHDSPRRLDGGEGVHAACTYVSDGSFVEAGVQHFHQLSIRRSRVGKVFVNVGTPSRTNHLRL